MPQPQLSVWTRSVHAQLRQLKGHTM